MNSKLLKKTSIEATVGEVQFDLGVYGKKWPIRVSYEVLQDLAKNNGHSPTESPMALFKAYEEEITAVAMKSIHAQVIPKPIFINADSSPWLSETEQHS